MGKALTDIGNGGLESTPIARRTNPEHLSASAAAVAGKPDCLRTSVKPGRNKTMAPQPPVALRANCHLGPLAKLAQLEQTLDGKVQEQYQGSVLGEFYSPCLGGKGWSSTLYPNFLIIGIISSLGRYNLPNSGFQSRHREQNHRHSVSTSCQTTPGRKEWRKQVQEAAAGIDGVKRKRIIELAIKLSEKMIPREGWTYDSKLSWLENAEIEDRRFPFHAIIAEGNPRDYPEVLTGSELGWTDDPRWHLKHEEVVVREAEAMSTILKAMLGNCSEVLFIDPHFRPDQDRYQRPLRSFLERATKNRFGRSLPNRIELQTSDDYSAQHFRSQCQRCLPRIVPNGIRILLKRWKQNETGQGLHNRYILTDIGGVTFGAGLDESCRDPERDTDDLSLMNKETFNLRWAQYAGPSPAFELAEEPIEIVGRADRQR